jgi:GntR family transcriptional regulator
MVDADVPQWPREQVAAELRRRIRAGEIGPRLPSRAQLADEFGVSHMTMQRALDMLRHEGLIHSVPGLGSFTTGRS